MSTDTDNPKNRVTFTGWLPAQEAAEHLGVSREYIYRLKAIYENGGVGIPGFLLGDKSRLLMFRITDLDAYKDAHPDLGKGRAKTEDDAPAPELAVAAAS